MHNKRIIISLTSWPKRVSNIKTTISSLMNQTLKPDLIELNLSKDEFTNMEQDIPEDLLSFIFENKDVVEINWVNGNSGVFKKIIPTLKKFYGEDYYLLSVDDDCFYRKDYIQRMVSYIEEFDGDSFCLSVVNVIGNRQIYKSLSFKEDFWGKLSQDVIDTRIDDLYIEHYLKVKNRKLTHFKPSDTPDMIKEFNPIFPNSHNTKNGQYSFEDIRKANEIISKIKFDE